VRRSTGREVSWWISELAQLRKNTHKLFIRAKKTAEWTEYSRALTEYNRVLRKAKRDLWRRLCQETEEERFLQVLAKDTINLAGTL
jgi:hypothetical protein